VDVWSTVSARGRRWVCCVLVIIGATAVAGFGGQDPASPPAVLVYSQATNEDSWLQGAEEWVWRANADGSDPVRLTRGDDPFLSPDGRAIVYEHADGLWAIPVEGGMPRLLYGLERPREHLGSVTSRPGTDELALEVEFATAKRKSSCPTTTSSSPDSFTGCSDGSIWVREVMLLNVATGASRRLRIVLPKLVSPCVCGLSFSPDGRELALQIDSGVGSTSGSDIYVDDLPGSNLRRLTSTHRARAPVWGPSEIAFAQDAAGGHGDVWVVNGDGTGLRQLTHTSAAILPAGWSEDGAELLAFYPPMHNGQVWAVDVATGEARTLTPSKGLVPQGLSADGTTVLVGVGCVGTLSPFGYIETVPWAGGDPTVLVKGPCRADWSR
jgi:Tol biopolymer transport system component